MIPTLEVIIAETTGAVRKACEEYLARCPKPEPVDMLRYGLESKAACDRALVVRLGHEAFGGDWRAVMAALVAAELMDSAVIITDDVLDRAPRRMSRPSHPFAYGQNMTVIAADILKSLGTIALLECMENLAAGSAQILEALRIYERDHVGIYVGQFLDVRYEELDLDDVSPADAIEMMRFTTGVQIGAMAALGAMLASAEVASVRSMEAFGTKLGTLFQLRDDFVDYVADEEATGKTPFLDFQCRKKRFPVLLALRVLPHEEAMTLRDLFAKEGISDEDMRLVTRLISSNPVATAAREQVQQMRCEALEDLEALREAGADVRYLTALLDLGCDI